MPRKKVEWKEWIAIIGKNLLMKFQVIPTRFTHHRFVIRTFQLPFSYTPSLSDQHFLPLSQFQLLSFPKCHFIPFYLRIIFSHFPPVWGRYRFIKIEKSDTPSENLTHRRIKIHLVPHFVLTTTFLVHLSRKGFLCCEVRTQNLMRLKGRDGWPRNYRQMNVSFLSLSE